MADALAGPSFQAADYVAMALPQSENRYTNCDVVAPPPASAGAERPAKGQGFPIGGT